MQYNYNIYKIKCITSMHVGSGDNNYGIVDKQIQRDPIDKIPIIHSSSYKGAMREYFKEVIGIDATKMTLIFGSENKAGKQQRAAFRFFDAHLLSIPVRGIHNTPFYQATSPCLIDKLSSYLTQFGIEFPTVKTESTDIAHTEFGEFSIINSLPQVAENLAWIDKNNTMLTKILLQLPIMARNYLDNGESKNLWYEELIPRESVFYFGVAYPDDIKEFNYIDDFENHLLSNSVQIGANATVGYGQCKISKF